MERSIASINTQVAVSWTVTERKCTGEEEPSTRDLWWRLLLAEMTLPSDHSVMQEGSEPFLHCMPTGGQWCPVTLPELKRRQQGWEEFAEQQTRLSLLHRNSEVQVNVCGDFQLTHSGLTAQLQGTFVIKYGTGKDSWGIRSYTNSFQIYGKFVGGLQAFWTKESHCDMLYPHTPSPHVPKWQKCNVAAILTTLGGSGYIPLYKLQRLHIL